MAYASNDIGSRRFLAANVIYQTTGKILDADDEGDADVLNDAVLMMDVITSQATMGDMDFGGTHKPDPVFLKEWQAIQNDRKDPRKAPYAAGQDRAQDDAFRWRELRAMFRSMCRQGDFARVDSPSAEWTPEVKR